MLLGTGPVIYRSESQRSTFLSDIDGLPAIGGGDCPELAFTGMINAFDEGPKYGSPMFVFTDASAKMQLHPTLLTYKELHILTV